jgi:hypothetical protein
MMSHKERPYTLPAGALMIEHRLIERMLGLMRETQEMLNAFKDFDSRLIDAKYREIVAGYEEQYEVNFDGK